MFFTLMDPYTGEIIVMSGKIINKETGVTDYAAGNYLDANLIGSTIKGGTLYTAFKEGVITPGTTFMDETNQDQRNEREEITSRFRTDQ